MKKYLVFSWVFSWKYCYCCCCYFQLLLLQVIDCERINKLVSFNSKNKIQKHDYVSRLNNVQEYYFLLKKKYLKYLLFFQFIFHNLLRFQAFKYSQQGSVQFHCFLECFHGNFKMKTRIAFPMKLWLFKEFQSVYDQRLKRLVC